MSKRLQGYVLALFCVIVAAICRKAVSPFIGFAIIYGFLLLAIWVSGRFGGLGPSVMALFLGLILVVVLRYTDRRFYWSPLEFQASLILYLVVGAIVCLLCHSERSGRASLLGQLAERQAATEALKAEQDVLRQTIEAQDQELQFIAYEVHDGLVQYATGALMALEGIRDQVDSEALAERIEIVVDVLRKTVDEGRRVISGIHATVLDDCGVIAAVQELVDCEERAHVHVELVTDDTLGRMAPKTERALYRITQEALTNVYKHSKSNRVRIELSRRGDRVHLEVRDWGVGLSASVNATGVHGLRGMAERARVAGGQCTVENACGGGTRVVADMPYLGATMTLHG